MRRPIRALAALVALLVPAGAQDEVFEHVALRVSSVRPTGEAIVDRGKRDGLQVGDRVLLMPRNGAVVHGSVTEIEDRSALVLLVDRNVILQPGTKGEVLLPRARRPVAPTERPLEQPPGPPGDPPIGARPTANAPDDGWRPGMPLLSGTRPSRPEERGSRVTGRAYTSLDITRTQGTFDNSFLRTGTDLEIENVAGYGGVLRVHGDIAWETETSDKTDLDLRFYELSYTIGGTRFDPTRWQFGRFLQPDMPEFGLLDGVAWGRRTESGHRLGASFGYLPELDEDLETLEDLQLAAWYLWSDSVAERLTAGVGLQKTWHHFSVDRDLVVGKVRYLPLDGFGAGWDFAATAWIDLFYGADQKRDGPGLTRMVAHAARRWQGGSGIELAYDHEEYPFQQREALPQTIQPATVLDAHQDRLTLHTFAESEAGTRFHARATGWADEQREGGAIEAGIAALDVLQSKARTGLTAFQVQGQTSSLLGLRIDHGGPLAGGRIDLLGEVSFVHHEGFPDNRDDLLQYRLGGYWTSGLGAHWDVTLYADSTLWDEEISFTGGFYLQRIF